MSHYNLGGGNKIRVLVRIQPPGTGVYMLDGSMERFVAHVSHLMATVR